MKKKLVKLIRVVLAAMFIFVWYKGMVSFVEFHYRCCPELYGTEVNTALFFILLLLMALLQMIPVTGLCLLSGYRLHRMRLLFWEITKADKLQIRLTRKFGWSVRLLPPRTDGTSPIAMYWLGKHLCFVVWTVLFGVLAAICWRTPAAQYMNLFFLTGTFVVVMTSLLPARNNGIDHFLTFRKSRDLRRAWECSLHLIAAADNKTKLRDMPAEWFLPYLEALKDEPLVKYANFNRSAWLIAQERYAEGYEALRYFFDLKPAPQTHGMIAMAILNGAVCEALADLPPMCLSQLDHPSLKLPLPIEWEAQRLQAEYARALFLHHDESEAAAILPKWKAALDKAGRDYEGVEKLQRKAGLLLPADAE